jgi:hypothetical protein
MYLGQFLLSQPIFGSTPRSPLGSSSLFFFWVAYLWGPLVALTLGAPGRASVSLSCGVGTSGLSPSPHGLKQNRLALSSHVAGVLRELVRIRPGVVRIRFLVTIYIYLRAPSRPVTPKTSRKPHHHSRERARRCHRRSTWSQPSSLAHIARIRPTIYSRGSRGHKEGVQSDSGAQVFPNHRRLLIGALDWWAHRSMPWQATSHHQSPVSSYFTY